MRQKIISNQLLKYEYIVYENAQVFNITTQKYLKASIDKRRPNESPIIYFKKKDGTREFHYLDELMCSCFIDDYKEGDCVLHKDNDNHNCQLSNLVSGNGYKLLRDVYHETKMWKPVNIGIKLYYQYFICEDGRLFNASTGSFIQPFEDKRKGNYNMLRYNLYKDKTIKDVIHFSASRLVALHFLAPNTDDKKSVLFYDRDHHNLHYSNLYWGDFWDSINQDIDLMDRESNRVLTCLKNNIVGKEKWVVLEINGIEFEFEYLISNFGRVYNNTKKFYCKNIKSNSCNLNNQHHLMVALKEKNRHYRNFFIHRLVAFNFCKLQEGKNTVNHINGNPECNWDVNLEWCTPLENMHHAVETNLSHSNKFENKSNYPEWRLNTIMAWVYSIKGVTDHKAYSIYVDYMNEYDDNCPILSFIEFKEKFEDKLYKDNDFMLLYNFYHEEYMR